MAPVVRWWQGDSDTRRQMWSCMRGFGANCWGRATLAIPPRRFAFTRRGPSYRELAAAGHVSRARLSQILQLNHLAPEIQEQLLFLPPTRQGFDRLLEKHVRSLALLFDWQKQKQLFRAVQGQLSL